MSDWIDFTIYAAFLALLWIWFPSRMFCVWRSLARDRNRDWLARHPDQDRKLGDGRAILWPAYLAGALSVLAVVLVQTDLWPLAIFADGPRSYRNWQVMNLSAMVFVAYAGFAILILRMRGLKVPLAERRAATMEIRSVDMLVPRWRLVAVYTIGLANLAAYIAVGLLKLHAAPAEVYWRGLIPLVLVIGIFTFMAWRAVRRPPNRIDRIVGPNNRRIEMRIALNGMCLMLAAVDFLLFENAVQNHILDGRVDRLMFAVFELLLFGLLFSLIKRIRAREAALQAETPSGSL